jgi:hypothetical protein
MSDVSAIGSARLAPAIAGALASLVLSCSPAPTTQRCSRYDVPSMGPENNFRISLAAATVPALDSPDDRMDVTFSIVPPIAGPVVLVHSEGGSEKSRWQLAVPAGSGISTRCRIGATAALSTCNATLPALPMTAAGEWSLEPGDNRVLEAGIALRVCR